MGLNLECGIKAGERIKAALQAHMPYPLNQFPYSRRLEHSANVDRVNNEQSVVFEFIKRDVQF
jgi:hypothetical protein